MSDFKRRDFLKTAAGVAAGTALGSGSILLPGEAAAQTYKAAPEKGAKLQVISMSLCYVRFVHVALGHLSSKLVVAGSNPAGVANPFVSGPET